MTYTEKHGLSKVHTDCSTGRDSAETLPNSLKHSDKTLFLFLHTHKFIVEDTFNHIVIGNAGGYHVNVFDLAAFNSFENVRDETVLW